MRISFDARCALFFDAGMLDGGFGCVGRVGPAEAPFD
jgi:hypothetical protein